MGPKIGNGQVAPLEEEPSHAKSPVAGIAGHVPLIGSLLALWRPWKGGNERTGPRSRTNLGGAGQVQQLRNELLSRCPGKETRVKLPPLQAVDRQIETHWQLRQDMRQLGKGANMVRMAFQAMRKEAAARPKKRTEHLRRHAETVRKLS